jgi:hypothetical protein
MPATRPTRRDIGRLAVSARGHAATPPRRHHDDDAEQESGVQQGKEALVVARQAQVFLAHHELGEGVDGEHGRRKRQHGSGTVSAPAQQRCGQRPGHHDRQRGRVGADQLIQRGR